MAATRRTKDDLKWSDLLTKALAHEADEVPPGWFTPEQLRKKFQLSSAAITSRLRSLLKAGKIERKKFKVAQGKRIMPISHYKLRGKF